MGHAVFSSFAGPSSSLLQAVSVIQMNSDSNPAVRSLNVFITILYFSFYYMMKQTNWSKYYYSDMTEWGNSSARIPVLLMTQKKITDKGRPYKNFKDDKFITDATSTSSGKTLYQRI